MAIYDSALDSVDELLYIKEALERINAQDAQYVAQLMAGMTQEEQAKFSENMAQAQQLKEREEVVRKMCDEVFDKK